MILSFANNIHTADGGTHETGFKNALTKVINEYGKKFGLLKDGTRLLGDDVREGLTAIVSVKLTECEFEGQTKGRLGNPTVRPFVEKMVFDKLMSYFEENPTVARAIFDKSLSAQNAREAAKKPEKPHGASLRWKALPSPESWQTVRKNPQREQSCTLSRVTRQAVPPRKEETGGIRQFSPSGAKC